MLQGRKGNATRVREHQCELFRTRLRGASSSDNGGLIVFAFKFNQLIHQESWLVKVPCCYLHPARLPSL